MPVPSELFLIVAAVFAWAVVWVFTPDCKVILGWIASWIRPPLGWIKSTQDETVRMLLRWLPTAVATIYGTVILGLVFTGWAVNPNEWLALGAFMLIALTAGIALAPRGRTA